jgi:ADP-glucose pyrophosphorylase
VESILTTPVDDCIHNRTGRASADIDRLLEIIAEKDRQAATLLKHAADTIEQKALIIAEKDEEIAVVKESALLMRVEYEEILAGLRKELAEKDAEIARLKARPKFLFDSEEFWQGDGWRKE